MFKTARRADYSTPLNTPIVIHRVGKPQHVNKDEVLRFLEDFITTKENLIDNTTLGINSENDTSNGSTDAMINIDTNLTSGLSQLKRIQRDFQGLPPASFHNNTTSTEKQQEEEQQEEGNKEEKITKSATGGTKKTFADED